MLIVDDERDSLLSLGLLCREEGMEVRLLREAASVEAVVAEFRPDVVLLDIVMPERNGLEIAEELTRRYGERCPVLVAVSAYSDEADRRMARLAGFHEFIAKPYEPQTLIRRLSLLRPR
ncbi:MAG TPA: response regulator [Burkholderiales bacterium]